MDLKVGETYVMKKAETSSDGGITYLKKGTHVRLVSIGSSRVLVQDLSDDALTDGIWSTYADNLVTEEEYDAMVDDEEPEPIKLEEGAIYVMKRAEVSGDGLRTYIKKGARVRIESFGTLSVLVKDLSEDALDDGVWMTNPDALMPLEDALEVGETYYMGKAETNSRGDVTFLKKGAIVRLEVWGKNRVVVQDLSDDKSGDGCWYTNPEYLVPIDKPEGSAAREEVEAEVAEKNKCVAPVVPLEDMVDDGVWMTSLDALMPLEDALKVGKVYTMAKAETNSRGDVTFLKKGAIVRLEVWGKDRVVVKDLTDTKTGDGVWYTNPEYLVPIDKPEGSISREEAEASDKNRCCVKEEENKSIAPIVPLEDVVVVKNKHYVSDHQPIETMQANMTNEEFIGFLKGNIIKYACRCGKKDEPLKEAEKIKQYAEWLCIVLSGGTIDPRS